MGPCGTRIEATAEQLTPFPGMRFGRRFGFGAGRGLGRRQRMTTRQRRLLNQETLDMADRLEPTETVTTSDLHRLTDILNALQKDVQMLHDRLDRLQERRTTPQPPADPKVETDESTPTETE